MLIAAALVLFLACALAERASGVDDPRRARTGVVLSLGGGLLAALPLFALGAGVEPPAITQPTVVPTGTALTATPTATGAATQGPTPSPTATPRPRPAANIPVERGQTSYGVTGRSASRPRFDDDQIVAALGVERRRGNACAVVFALPDTPDPYDQARLDTACAFVLRTLRLSPPDRPIPLFLRDARQAARGDLPSAGPVVIALNTPRQPTIFADQALAHELSHGLGGAGRVLGSSCSEEGIAQWVGLTSTGNAGDLIPGAREYARAGQLDDPRQLRAADVMYAGDVFTINRKYLVCGALVAFIVERAGGEAALAAFYRTGEVPGHDLNRLVDDFLAEVRR